MAALTPPHGWLVIDKPSGLGSTEVVSAIKRALKAGGYARAKVGHGGTLDPMATGVLPVAIGEATKVAGRLLQGCKAYRFTVAFGAATDTLDAEGRVTATTDARPTRETLLGLLDSFRGPIRQVPPAFSALNVNGRRAYALARAGEQVALAERTVEILHLGLSASEPDEKDGLRSASFDLRCSKGTYVRSLACDLAQAAGTLGRLTMLRRTIAGPFTLEHAISLDTAVLLGQTKRLGQALLPLTAALDDIPALAVQPDEAAKLRQGQRLTGRLEQPGLYLATDGPVPVALVDVSSAEVRVVRGFNL